MIVDADGVPLRRAIGYLPEWRREVDERPRVELTGAVGFAVETDEEKEE